MKTQSLIGESELWLDLLDQVSQLAHIDKPVLLLGDRGTGKELIAERLHYLSPRWDQTLIKLNCAALSESLLESDLFGHEAGAFTGAQRLRVGRFERAQGGSLFLDEIATCSARVQEKLLRVIEYGEFERVGGNKTLSVDVRIIAATHQDLTQATHFRPDLLDRLAFDVLHLPPLQLREHDVVLLAEHFARAMCQRIGRDHFAGFSPQALHALRAHNWPGNVRELRNVIERSVYRWSEYDQPVAQLVLNPFIPPWKLSSLGETTPSQTLPTTTQPTTGLREELDQQQRQRIEQALHQNQYHQRRTALALGITYHQLRAALRKFGMLPLKDYLRRTQTSPP